MTSPCSDCTHGCCRDYLVTVIGYDVWVIAKGLRLAPEQFLVTVPRTAVNGFGFMLDQSGQTHEIALDKKRVEVEHKPCIFWLDFPGGIGRCGIYPLRPLVCQTYPAFLEGGAVKRRGDVLCPEDAWRDGALQRPVWRERLLRMQIEVDIYGLAVARWNYHVQHTPHPGHISMLAYYSYLMHYYAQLEPVRELLNSDEWNRMCGQWRECKAQGTSPLNLTSPMMEPWSRVIDGIHSVSHSFFPDDFPSDRIA